MEVLATDRIFLVTIGQTIEVSASDEDEAIEKAFSEARSYCPDYIGEVQEIESYDNDGEEETP